MSWELAYYAIGMAKQSRAKIKMLQSQAKKDAAQRKAEKSAAKFSLPSQTPMQEISDHDQAWQELGLTTSVRRALVEDGLFSLTDLRKVSLAALKELEGMNANAVRILVSEMKKQDLSFRS
jgi:hypothetical protein